MHSHLHLYNLLSGLSLEHLPCYPNQTADPPPCAHQHPDHCQSSWELLQPCFGKFLEHIISLLVSFASTLIQALDKPTVFYKAVMHSPHDTTLVCLKFYKSSSLHVVMPLRKRCLSMRKVQGHKVESCTSDFLCPCQAVHEHDILYSTWSDLPSAPSRWTFHHNTDWKCRPELIPSAHLWTSHWCVRSSCFSLSSLQMKKKERKSVKLEHVLVSDCAQFHFYILLRVLAELRLPMTRLPVSDQTSTYTCNINVLQNSEAVMYSPCNPNDHPLTGPDAQIQANCPA